MMHMVIIVTAQEFGDTHFMCLQHKEGGVPLNRCHLQAVKCHQRRDENANTAAGQIWSSVMSRGASIRGSQ